MRLISHTHSSECKRFLSELVVDQYYINYVYICEIYKITHTHMRQSYQGRKRVIDVTRRYLTMSNLSTLLFVSYRSCLQK